LVNNETSIWIHTDVLPHLPYEPGTYVNFQNLDRGFNTLHEMYQKHASWSREAKKLKKALKIMTNETCSASELCDMLTRTQLHVSVSSDDHMTNNGKSVC
jgi:hypothetical protein